MNDLVKESRDDETKYPALEAIVSSFGPLREIQTKLEASDYLTMHLLIPMLEHARKALKSLSEGHLFGPMLNIPHPIEIAFAKLTLRHLDTISFHPLWVVGCLLNPRLRALSMVWEGERRNKYLDQGNVLLRKTFSDLVGSSPNATNVEMDGTRNERRNRILNGGFGAGEFNLEEHLDIYHEESESQKDELTRYSDYNFTHNECSLALEKHFGVVCFWLSIGNKYPILCNIALRIFAIPVSSTPSERNFSHVKRIVTDERSRLASDIVEDLVCSHSFLQK